jgi:hypothetical protein
VKHDICDAATTNRRVDLHRHFGVHLLCYSTSRRGAEAGEAQRTVVSEMEMDETQKQFFAVVDEFINLANKLVEKHGTPRVSSTILFAASRFNAHNYYATDGKRETREAMVDYYCEQYRKMLLDNLDWLEALRQK